MLIIAAASIAGMVVTSGLAITAMLARAEAVEQTARAEIEAKVAAARAGKAPPKPKPKPTATAGKKGDKLKPNDPCPCGSGKEYKKCHGQK